MDRYICPMHEHGEKHQAHGTVTYLLILLKLARWQFVTAIDVVVELILVCLAAVLVHDLKMPLTKKAAVVLAFLFRLPCVYPKPRKRIQIC